MKIEIFGPGCARCKQTEHNARQALSAVGLDAEVIKIEDIREYAPRGSADETWRLRDLKGGCLPFTGGC